MSLRLAHITLDCDDVPKVAGFWAAALDKEVDEGASEFFATIDGANSDVPTMMFLKVPESKSTKNRMHVDLGADDRAAEVERLVGLGATHVADKDEWGFSWSVMADVEGNEFCVG